MFFSHLEIKHLSALFLCKIRQGTGKLDILKISTHILKESFLSKRSIAFNQNSGIALTEIPSYCPSLPMTKASHSAPEGVHPQRTLSWVTGSAAPAPGPKHRSRLPEGRHARLKSISPSTKASAQSCVGTSWCSSSSSSAEGTCLSPVPLTPSTTTEGTVRVSFG